MSREDIYSALFSLLQGLKTAGHIKVCDRRVRFLEEMAISELPALFMSVDRQHTAHVGGLPSKRTLAAKVYLYAANPDKHRSAGVVMNGLLDIIEQTMTPPPAEEFLTLGGLVRHAWIDGSIEVFEGPQGEKTAAILTITMLVP